MIYFHKTIIVLLLCFSSLSRADNKAENTMVLSYGDLGVSAFQLMSKRILTQAYSEIGKGVEFEKFPDPRALYAANNGDTDGELARVDGLEKEYLNLIKISIPIAYEEIFVYSKNPNLKINGWQSLQFNKIGYMSGFTRAAKKTAGMNTEKVSTVKQGLQKLNLGRTDVFIGGAGPQCLINKLKMTEIIAIDKPLERITFYHYLHKRHFKLADKLKKVLKEMEDSGEIASIQKQAKQDFIVQCR